jgi:hypothetical protein
MRTLGQWVGNGRRLSGCSAGADVLDLDRLRPRRLARQQRTSDEAGKWAEPIGCSPADVVLNW